MSIVPTRIPSASISWIAIGGVWIAAGFLLNSWTIAAVLNVEQWGPISLALIWGSDVLLLAWGLVTILRSHNDVVKNLNVLALTVVGLLLSAEAVLRCCPSILSQHFANGLTTKYSTKEGGIYYLDPALGMNFMVPNFRTDMHYNGYTWVHQTDAYGFRNAETRQHADALVLGDSHIYGHGVNLDQTVGHFIEELTGLTVVNLGRQGDSSFQEAYLLHEYIGQFAPHFVFYFFCENDIPDVYSYQTDDELRQFIKTPLTNITYPPRTNPAEAIRSRDTENSRGAHTGSIIDQITHRAHIVAVWKWVRSLQKDRELARRTADEEHAITNPDALGWQYTKHAISFMRRMAHERGAEFIIVPIPPANKTLTGILERFAHDQGIPFINTDAMDRDKPGSREWYLPHDYHFSGQGAKMIAALVARYVEGCLAVSSPHCHQVVLK